MALKDAVNVRQKQADVLSRYNPAGISISSEPPKDVVGLLKEQFSKNLGSTDVGYDSQKRIEDAKVVFKLIRDDVNMLRDLYEVSKNFSKNYGASVSEDESNSMFFNDITNWMTNENSSYGRRLDALEERKRKEYLNAGYSDEEASRRASAIALEKFKYDRDYLIENWNPDIAYTDKYVIDPATTSYQLRTNENSDYPTTTGELLSMYAGYSGLDTPSYLANWFSVDRTGSAENAYPSKPETMADIAVGLVAPRSWKGAIDDEYLSKNGNSQIKNAVGDVGQFAVENLPWERAVSLFNKGRKLLRLGETGNRLYNNQVGFALARGLKHGAAGATKMLVGDAAGSVYDSAAGTDRGYDFSPIPDIIGGSLGEGIYGIIRGEHNYNKMINKLWNKLTTDPSRQGLELIKRKGWKSASDIDDEWIELYKGYYNRKLPFQAKVPIERDEFGSNAYKGLEDYKISFDTDLNLDPNEGNFSKLDKAVRDDYDEVNRGVDEAVLGQKQRRVNTAEEKYNGRKGALDRYYAAREAELKKNLDEFGEEVKRGTEGEVSFESGDPTAHPRTTNTEPYSYYYNNEDDTWWRVDKRTGKETRIETPNKDVYYSNEYGKPREMVGYQFTEEVPAVESKKPSVYKGDRVPTYPDQAEEILKSQERKAKEELDNATADLNTFVTSSAGHSSLKPSVSELPSRKWDNVDHITEDIWDEYCRRTYKKYKFPSPKAMKIDREMVSVRDALEDDLQRMKYKSAKARGGSVDYDMEKSVTDFDEIRSGNSELPLAQYGHINNQLRPSRDRTIANKESYLPSKDDGNAIRMEQGRVFRTGDKETFDRQNREGALRYAYGNRIGVYVPTKPKLDKTRKAVGLATDIGVKETEKFDIPSFFGAYEPVIKKQGQDEDEAFTDEDRIRKRR